MSTLRRRLSTSRAPLCTLQRWLSTVMVQNTCSVVGRLFEQSPGDWYGRNPAPIAARSRTFHACELSLPGATGAVPVQRRLLSEISRG